MLALALALGSAPIAAASRARPTPAPAPIRAPEPAAIPLAAEFPPDAVTEHSIAIDGRTIDYTARVGTITLRNAMNQPTAKMSYVAYTVGNDARRPVTFLYNGGPGSSTMWLLMGSVGPVHVVTPGDRLAGSPPYRWIPNTDSILDKTDLVFVDMPNTGFGRIMGAGKPQDFFGLQHDAAAFAQFIRRYITTFHRWNSPKFLFGESYGTPRSAELSQVLFNEGISLNGIVSQSSILDFHLDWSQNYPYLYAAVGGGNIGYALYFPTMAATAWYHGMVPRRGTEEAFIRDAARFAMASYLHALMRGSTLGASETRSMAEQMHAYIGLPVHYLIEEHLMVPYGRFLAGLLRDRAQTLGRYDSRFTVTTLDPEETEPGADASDDAMTAPYTSAVNEYLRDALRYDPALPYNYNTYALIAKTGLRSWRQAEGDINVAPALAQTMADNPQMLVFSANGYYDFATPWLATQYTLQHLNLPPDLQRNISFGFYQSGHMVYLNQSALDAYHNDLERWYDEALHP
ncbi:MAG: S10 family peptidase [Candidatus Tyrphobacter sp.]